MLMQLAVALLALAEPAAAGHEAQCVAVAKPPQEMASWSARVPRAAVGQAARLGEAQLVLGTAVDASLLSTPEVHYSLRPEKPGGTVSYGGLFSFRVDRAGTYRVALGSAAWIDVVRNGKAVESTSHGHGPECTGIRKMVDFPLTPGNYVLQVAANGEAKVPLLVLKLP